nr:MAG TPA: hypothetical protein [Caudoviricetes sp.]
MSYFFSHKLSHLKSYFFILNIVDIQIKMKAVA